MKEGWVDERRVIDMEGCIWIKGGCMDKMRVDG